MHVVGFFHEMQRMDRDRHVQIFWKNIQPLLVSQYETTLERGYQYEDGVYDYGSIMHYPRFVKDPFLLDPNKPTMTATIYLDENEDKESTERKWHQWEDNNAMMG